MDRARTGTQERRPRIGGNVAQHGRSMFTVA
jgi:hypothetical protein